MNANWTKDDDEPPATAPKRKAARAAPKGPCRLIGSEEMEKKVVRDKRDKILKDKNLVDKKVADQQVKERKVPQAKPAEETKNNKKKKVKKEKKDDAARKAQSSPPKKKKKEILKNVRQLMAIATKNAQSRLNECSKEYNEALDKSKIIDEELDCHELAKSKIDTLLAALHLSEADNDLHLGETAAALKKQQMHMTTFVNMKAAKKAEEEEEEAEEEEEEEEEEE